MQKNNLFTFSFVVVIVAVAGLILALSSQLLSERQERNIANDRKRNILTALGVIERDESSTPERLEEIYRQSIIRIVIDHEGHRLSGPQPERVDTETEQAKSNQSDRRYPVFIYQKDGRVEGYCFPVFGKGLWSTIYGYLALERDLNTVRGFTVYRQGETPGLGAKVAGAEFLNRFTGKKIYDREKRLVAVEVVKGEAADTAPHQVDGITAATMTSQGVTALLKKDLKIYDPFIRREREKRGRP